MSREPDCSSIFEDVFKLQYLFSMEKFASKSSGDPDSWKHLVEIFNLVGSKKFAEIISIVKGCTITFPTEEEYQESILTTLCYYYKEVQNKTWDEIKDILNISKNDSIKYGIRVRQLRNFVDDQLLKTIEKLGAEHE